MFLFKTVSTEKPLPPRVVVLRRVGAQNAIHDAHGLDILTLGQYLQPTKRHLDVAEFITPDQFAHYKEEGLRRGLKYVESGPLVRSSYHAERHVNVPV